MTEQELPDEPLELDDPEDPDDPLDDDTLVDKLELESDRLDWDLLDELRLLDERLLDESDLLLTLESEGLAIEDRKTEEETEDVDSDEDDLLSEDVERLLAEGLEASDEATEREETLGSS